MYKLLINLKIKLKNKETKKSKIIWREQSLFFVGIDLLMLFLYDGWKINKSEWKDVVLLAFSLGKGLDC